MRRVFHSTLYTFLFTLSPLFLLSCSTVNPTDPSAQISAWRSGQNGVLSSTGGGTSVAASVPSSSSTGGGASVASSSPSSSSTGGGTSVASSGTPGTPLVYSGQTYKTVVIGAQTWMAENLNFTTTTGSMCYDNLPANCTTYGMLYDYKTALTVCPSGWHLPDTTSWNTLETAVGGKATAGTKLKANSTLWSTNTGTDDYGFSALPGGNYSGTTFNNVGNFGNWWAATSNGSSSAYGRYMYYNDVYVGHSSYSQTGGFSVRCLKDSN